MEITANTQEAYKLIHDGILALARAERRGIRVDTKYCQKQRKRLTKKIDRNVKKLKDQNFIDVKSSIETNYIYSNPPSRILYKPLKIETD